MSLRLVLILIFAALPVSSAPMIWLAESSPGFQKSIRMDEQTRDLILEGLDGVEFQVEPTNPQRGLKRLQQEPKFMRAIKFIVPSESASILPPTG
ncbi:hypothetical protein [Lacimicrobium alkaliphilum]|uniref:hypothetical protein n=1 Tax=Lacimicrobium alkaliphilum TaxID=1526571 RepID=UPI001179EF78|nr:hypothetical protein [Lacimicrobium alkaliphilum]